MLNLRWYQSEGVAAFFDYFCRYGANSGNPIGAFPTGTGKSVIIAEFLRQLFRTWPASRVLMLTHVKELIAQNAAELSELWPTAPLGVFSAGLGRKEVRPITFAGIKSIAGKVPLFGHVDLVLIDECHTVSPKDDTVYRQTLAELATINPRVKVMGLTATPYRLGQGLLTEPVTRDGKTLPPLFTDICFDVTGLESFNRLIAEGHLAPLVPPGNLRTQLDVSGVAIRGGEFVANELQAAVDKEEVTHAAIEEVIERGADRKHWLVFGTGERHCEHIVSCLDSLGITAAMVTSTTSDEDREKHVADFKAGRIRALVNNNIFTTGFNFRAIDLIAVLRPTSSPVLWVQMLGRGTRPFPGKENCLVLDFAGNTRRLGPINDPVIPKKRRSNTGEIVERGAPVRLCPHCSVWNHSAARVCISCKGEFPLAQVKIEAEASTDALIVGTAPIIEVFRVSSVNYRKHTPHPMSGKPPSLYVSYYCGLRTFSEWVCLEHTGYPTKKGRDWWRKMADDFDTEPPATIDEAVSRLNSLQRPTHLRVWVNTKQPQVMAHDFSGTAFGSVLPGTDNPPLP